MTHSVHAFDPQILASDAHGFASHYAVKAWFDAHVISPRACRNRIKDGKPLKPHEADRFQRLQVLIERAVEAFGSERCALHWLRREQTSFNGATPLDTAIWERNFLVVLDQLKRIEHGIYR